MVHENRSEFARVVVEEHLAANEIEIYHANLFCFFHNRYATLVDKSYSARTQSYTLTFKPRSAKGLGRPTSGVGTIVVRERNLFERFCETIRF